MKIKEFLKSIEGLAANTTRNYRATLWQLHSTIAGDEPTKEEIYRFLKMYAPSSLHRHRAAIKVYLEYMGIAWPFTRRQFASKRQRIYRYVSPDVVQEIIDAGGDQDEKMFITALFQLGCRISELRSIEQKNLTPSGVRVVTKGGNEYLKLTTKSFNKELSAYAQGKKGKIFPHTYNYYDQLLKRLANKAGRADVSLHMLRHGRAIDLLRKGMALSDLQQFLNHASIATTAIYLQVDHADLAKQLEIADGNVED